MITAPQWQDKIQIPDFHPAGAEGTDPVSTADPVKLRLKYDLWAIGCARGHGYFLGNWLILLIEGKWGLSYTAPNWGS
jgi:hypothetical protein